MIDIYCKCVFYTDFMVKTLKTVENTHKKHRLG